MNKRVLFNELLDPGEGRPAPEIVRAAKRESFPPTQKCRRKSPPRRVAPCNGRIDLIGDPLNAPVGRDNADIDFRMPRAKQRQAMNEPEGGDGKRHADRRTLGLSDAFHIVGRAGDMLERHPH